MREYVANMTLKYWFTRLMYFYKISALIEDTST